jgi:hypothetical protein
LLDLKDGNTCDEDDPSIPETLTDRFVFARIRRKGENATEAPTNCSVVERARLVSVVKSMDQLRVVCMNMSDLEVMSFPIQIGLS